MLIEPEERLGPPAGSWYSRWLFERALALIYFTAFLVAVNQFVPLLGEHGLLPVPDWVRHVPFRASPSLFYLFPTTPPSARLRGSASRCRRWRSLPPQPRRQPVFAAAKGGCTGKARGRRSAPRSVWC
jgi:hypothetical protein